MLSSTFINGTLRENEERMNEVCFKASRQLRSYWAHLHID